jgi:hypothetical protein
LFRIICADKEVMNVLRAQDTPCLGLLLGPEVWMADPEEDPPDVSILRCLCETLFSTFQGPVCHES